MQTSSPQGIYTDILHILFPKGRCTMESKSKNTTSKSNNLYDDGNIPDVDLPQNNVSAKDTYNVEPLPESSRPRKDGPGGD